ncbi:hypothetical protein VP01_541g9 [Puccinia sorghi]|uniref:Cryptic loci regulator 2 N-terminal domain-containing protein n=1 Tax=Puccinia sorghi TaxID=27349 RepID=A0A0L6UJR1_9BASI|nr:hypothetical protein VP01_541g9 [Puccinia sorghi]
MNKSTSSRDSKTQTIDSSDPKDKNNSNRRAHNMRVAPSCVNPGLQDISLVVSDGAFVRPSEVGVVGRLKCQGVEMVQSQYCWTPVEPDSVAKRRWLKTLGQALAAHFSLARGRDKFTLADFPKGYQLFHHVKDSVQTAYLFGYPTKSNVKLKFKTAAEFLPHLTWLASQGEMKKCLCKHCQSEVIDLKYPKTKEGFSPPPRSSFSWSNSFYCRKSPNFIFRNFDPGSHSQEKNSKKNQRVQDNHQEINLASYDTHQPEIPSNYRALELVWCKLDQPKDNKIRLDCTYWPGICQKTHVAYEACEVLDLSTRENQPGPPRIRKMEDGTSATWTTKKEVHKKLYWSIQLLGLSDSVVRAESQILPWLYRPFEEPAWSVVSTGKLPIPEYLLDASKPMPTLASLSNPVIGRLHFQLALQTGAEIEETWALAEYSDGLAPTSLRKSFPPIGTQDLVRLKLLESPPDPAAEVVSLDSGQQILFLHIDFFWKGPYSDSTIVGGWLFELVPQHNTKSPQDLTIQGSGTGQTRNAWLMQYADQIPKGACTSHSDHLPPAPKGFQFSRITPAGAIHHVDISCIAGRYYSPKVDHDRLARLRYHFATKIDSSPSLKSNPETLRRLASLLGFGIGQDNFMRFTKLKRTREQATVEALRKSKRMVCLILRPINHHHLEKGRGGGIQAD